MHNHNKSTRRELFSMTGGGAILAFANSAAVEWVTRAGASERPNTAGINEEARETALNLLTDP
jgi:hypothetical protein